MEIKKIGIMGAGIMGGGIAHVIAQAGLRPTIVDVSEEIVHRAIDKITKRLMKSVEKGKLTTGEKDEIIARILPATDIEILHDSDLVIEAVVEDLHLKAELFKRLQNVCPEAIFASNTSTLSITEMASAVSVPDKFVGIHYFNPVPAMRLVEIIPGLQTSAETVETCSEFTKRIRKIPVLVQNCPGFLVNRIFMPYAGEAMLAAQEGAARPEEIDRRVRDAGFPMGPLALNDMVGLDVAVHTFPVLYEAYGDRFPVPLLFERLVGAGRTGLKAGKGIYMNGQADGEFFSIVRKIQNETGVKNTEFSVERLILRQVNEAIYCLQEKIATAEDIDRAMVLGTGFPCDENGVGGPLHWADERGLDWVLERLNNFKDTLGPRFWPHNLLKQYLAAGYKGKIVGRGFFQY